MATSVATSSGGNPMRRADAVDDLHADVGVIARKALADVVQQRADEEQVGPLDVADELGGVGGRLAQVPVDGEAVIGVALRLVPHRSPLWEQPHEHAVLVERFRAR